MAAARDPDEVLRSTRGKDNFQRLARLLISGGTALLREVFDKICPPINLPTILKNPATQKQLKGANLTKPQWDCLYPSPGTYGTSAEFDVTLLFRLLRTICTLTPPATGWDALPASADYSQEGMERLQEGLKRAAHAIEKQGQLLENTFQKKGQDLKDQLTPIYENVQSLFQEQARDIKLDEVYQTIDGLQLLVREETQDMEGKLKTSIYENVQSLFREEARDIRHRLDEVYQTIDGLRLLVRDETQVIKEKLETPIYENVQSLLREQARDIKDKLDEVYQTIDGLRSTIGSSQAAEGEGSNTTGTGTTYNIDIHGGGPIAIGDGTNLYTEFPRAPARDTEDSDPIYDVPRVTTSNQHEQQQQQQQQEQHQAEQHRHQQQQQQPPQQRQHQKHQKRHQQQKQHQTEDTSNFNQSDGFILNNVEQLVNELDQITNEPQWKDKEHSILQGVETSLRGPCSNKMVVYQALAKMSCSRSSSKLVSYALRQLDCLMRRDNLESGKNNLLGVEKILRFSISSPDAVFKDDGNPERKLRLSVYSRILALIIIQQTLQGKVFAVHRDLEAELLEFQDYLKKSYNQTKDGFRYSMEFIQKAISYLLRPSSDVMTSKVRSFLTECQENIKEPSDECKEPSFIDMMKNRKVLTTSIKKKKTKWLALHCVILYLQRKVHCSGEDSADGRALSLLLRVIEAYRDGGGGNDWRFCFLASSVLSEIAMNTDVIKENRIKAGGCLVNLLKDQKVQKEQICRATVQGLSRPMLFCPDSSTRELLAPQLCYGENSCYILPEHLHTELLVARQQVLQIKATISQSSRFFVKNGVFHGKSVAVKVLYVTNQSILENRSPECQQAEQRLIQEASFLARLKKLKQPNFPVLLSYNTESLPYHLITEYESYGNLLQLLQKSHKEHAFLTIAEVFGMLINIAEALQFLHQLKMVHRAVMADNVLVGSNYVCKLSGLHSVLEITGKALNKSKDSNEHRSLLLRWKAPEVLKESRYSTASDVWSFGILMYEMLTHGCYPYKHLFLDQDVYRHVVGGGILPRESCFEDDEYELMKECWKWRRRERISLPMLTAKLRKMHAAMKTSGNEKPRPIPPTLEPHITKGLEDLKESVHCSQPGHFSDDSSYSLTVEKDGLLVRETTKKGDKLHRKRLLALKHPNLAINFASETSHAPFLVIEMVSIATDLGNLKEYVLNGNCQEGTIVAFLSQISSALHHLHEKHIVHGELRAEHIYVVQPNKVQIVRLGRCKFLVMRPDEETSKSCVEQGDMPHESTAWSAPEVILQGNYSHASDVWSFGVVAWEVFAAFTHDESSRDKTLPYADLTYDEILPSIQGSKLLSKPESCPEWIFIMIRQCWAYQPKQRPPAIALLDCLTARKPMQSWLMKLWLDSHCMEQWPNLSISQPEDAFHVINDEDHPHEEDIKKMCSDGFFAEHEYQYVSVNSYSESPVRDNKAITTDDYELLSDVRPFPAPRRTGNEVAEAPPLRPPRRLLPGSRSRPLPLPPPQP